MAIKLGANLAYNGKLPNFERDKFVTKAAMKAFDENSIDEGHLSYCEEDGNIYQYKSANTVDTTTGKWRLFKTEADAALNGTSTNAIQNKAVFDALKLKADAAALAAYQPKYKADYIAKEDLSELPITKGILDLNGHSINASFSNQDGELTIQNGTILKIAEINAALNIINCTIENTYVRAVHNYDVTFNYSNIKILGTNESINCHIFNSNVGSLGCDCNEIYIYNSTVNELTCDLDGYRNVVIGNSYISTISYDPTLQPENYGSIYLYNCFFETLALDNYPGTIDVQLLLCCDYSTDITYVNGYYDKTNGLRELAYSTKIQKGDNIAPTADAVYNALAAYQSKYKADYIATKDFNYSELPADVHSIDLNGYTMRTNKNITISSQEFYNGTIQLDTGNQTDGCEFHHVYINALSKYEDIDSIYEYCTINRMNVISATSIKFSAVSNTNFAACEPNGIIFTIIKDSTFSFGPDEFLFGESVIIDDSLYKTCHIKNNKPIDKGYESNIDNPTIPGNAPSCEAVNGKITIINNSITDLHSSLESIQTDFVNLRNKVNAMPKTVFITQAAYNALTTKDPNTIYYING